MEAHSNLLSPLSFSTTTSFSTSSSSSTSTSSASIYSPFLPSLLLRPLLVFFFLLLSSSQRMAQAQIDTQFLPHTTGGDGLPEGTWVVIEPPPYIGTDFEDGPKCGLSFDYWKAKGLSDQDARRASSYYFSVRKGDPTKLLVEFQGGGGCWNEETCSDSSNWFQRTDEVVLDPAYPPATMEMAICAINGHKLCVEIDQPSCPCSLNIFNPLATEKCVEQNLSDCAICSDQCGSLLGQSLTAFDLCADKGAGGLAMHLEECNHDGDSHPYMDHTHVLVTYCTGDLHWGTRTENYSENLEVRHHGHANARYVLDWVSQAFPPEQVNEVVVSGCSAGSYGAGLFSDYIFQSLSEGGYGYRNEGAQVVMDGALGVTDSKFTLEGFSKWGVLFPEHTDTNLACDFNQWTSHVASFHPDVRFGMVNNKYDSTQLSFAKLMMPSLTLGEFAECAETAMSALSPGGPLAMPNFDTYYFGEPGDSPPPNSPSFHCTTQLTGRLYTEECPAARAGESQFRVVDFLHSMPTRPLGASTTCTAPSPTSTSASCPTANVLTCPLPVPLLEVEDILSYNEAQAPSAVATLDLSKYFPQSTSPSTIPIAYSFAFDVTQPLPVEIAAALQLNAETGVLTLQKEGLLDTSGGAAWPAGTYTFTVLANTTETSSFPGTVSEREVTLLLHPSPEDPCSEELMAECVSQRRETCTSGSAECGPCTVGFYEDLTSGTCNDVCNTTRAAFCDSLMREGCLPGLIECGECKPGYHHPRNEEGEQLPQEWNEACVDVCDDYALSVCEALRRDPCAQGTGSSACGDCLEGLEEADGCVDPCNEEIAEACFDLKREGCTVGTGSKECGECLQGYVEIDGSCVLGCSPSWEDICLGQNRERCQDGEAGGCGVCLPDYGLKNGICVPLCTEESVSACTQQNREPCELGVVGTTCGDCIFNYEETPNQGEGGGSYCLELCSREVLDQCFLLNKEGCVPGSRTCGACLPTFWLNSEGACVEICSDQIKQQCAAQNRESCIVGYSACGQCLFNYEEGSDGKCYEVCSETVKSTCYELNRGPCKPGIKSCGDCLADYEEDPIEGVCREPYMASELDSGGFFTPGELIFVGSMAMLVLSLVCVAGLRYLCPYSRAAKRLGIGKMQEEEPEALQIDPFGHHRYFALEENA